MIAGIAAGCYALAWLVSARIVFYVARQDEYLAPDDGMDYMLLAAMSVLTGLMWPLALPIALVVWHPRKTATELREAAATAEWERQKLATRIAELEREAGISP